MTNEEKPTREMLDGAAALTAAEARREIRDRFQIDHPHYTPPEGAEDEAWIRWLQANLKMHGDHGEFGFVARGLRAYAPKWMQAEIDANIAAT